MKSHDCKSKATAKPKREVTERMIAANRANARKSTGPKTAVGKERSRRNALKHGMSSVGTVLPIDLEAKFLDLNAKWVDQLHPEGYVEAELIKRAVASSIKLDWLDAQFNLVVAKQTREAAVNFESRERRAALLEAEGLVDDPFAAVNLLKNSVAGCDWLIGQWKELQNSLSDGLDDDRIAHALRLLGVRPEDELSTGQANIRQLLVRTQSDAERPIAPNGSPIDAETVRHAVHSFFDELIEGLENERAELVGTHEEICRQAVASAMLPFGKAGALWPRYQGIHAKGFHQALHDLIKIRKLDDPPRPDDFRRDPVKERARNEAVRDSRNGDFSSASDEFRAEISDRSAANDREFKAREREFKARERELRKTASKLELLELRMKAQEALKRREERLGRTPRNEPVADPQTVLDRQVASKKSNPIAAVMKVACVLLAFLLGARAIGSSKGSSRGGSAAIRPVGKASSAVFEAMGRPSARASETIRPTKRATAGKIGGESNRPGLRDASVPPLRTATLPA